MQCNRCGASREPDARVCPRCGCKFESASAPAGAIPSIDSFPASAGSAPTSVPPTAAAPTPTAAPAPADAASVAPIPSSGQADDIVEPVFNPTIHAPADANTQAVTPLAHPANDASNPSSNTSDEVVEPCVNPAGFHPQAASVAPAVSTSTASSGSLRDALMTPLAPLLASKKNRFLALGATAVVVLLIVGISVAGYFNGLIHENDIKTMLNSSDIMQHGLLYSEYVEDSPYSVKDLKIESQKTVSGDARKSLYYSSGYTGNDDIHEAAIKATIANESFETSFTAVVYAIKTNQGWKAVIPITPDQGSVHTKPLKGVTKMPSSEENTNVEEGDLQEANGGYTSSVKCTRHDKRWYGDVSLTRTCVFTFSNEKGWTLTNSGGKDVATDVAWSVKGKTFEETNKQDWNSTQNVSVTINDISTSKADISYSISSVPSSNSSGDKEIKLSGRKPATCKLNHGNLSIELNDPDNKVSIVLKDGGTQRVAGRGDVQCLRASIITQSVMNPTFNTKFNASCNLVEK